MPEIFDEHALIRRCQEGDMAAFESVYRMYNASLYRSAFLTLGSEDDARDAIQNTFIKLYKGIRRFEFRSEFKTWLFRIMINVCNDMRKKKQMGTMREIPDHGFEPAPETRLTLENAVRQLPDRMRECFVLFAVEELKQSEIAGLLGLTEGAVKAHVFSARQKLKKILSADIREQ